MDNGDPMHGVYPTQDTSRMDTTRAKQDEDDIRIKLKESYEKWKEGSCMGTVKGKVANKA